MKNFICAIAPPLISVLLTAVAPARAADPTTADCLSANDKSITLRNQHKLRAARAQVLVCAAPSCPADVRKECVRRVDEVNASMPTIVFEVKDAGGNDLTAVKVSMDGEALADRLEGTAISLDPGSHTFTLEPAGQAPVTRPLVIREGEKDRHVMIELTASPAPASADASLATNTATAAPPQALAPAPEEAPTRNFGTQKVLALVAGGIGVVGVGLGTVFGLQSKSKHDDAVNACPAGCDAAGVSLMDDARSAGNVSTVAFIVGGIGLAGGAVLWFTAPSKTTPAVARFGAGPGFLQLRGAW
jgi:hypothetical protein